MTEAKPPTSVSEIRGGLTAKEGFDHVINESIGRNLSSERAIVLSIMLLYKSGEVGKEPEVASALPARWISREKASAAFQDSVAQVNSELKYADTGRSTKKVLMSFLKLLWKTVCGGEISDID